MERVLNVPIRLLKASKDDKQQFELLAAAVLFKMIHDNSIVGKITNKSVRTELHCKYDVAKRLIEQFDKSDLFSYNKKNGVLFVRTFKDRTWKSFKKGCIKAQSDYCKKIKVGNYTLKEMKRILREALLENTFQAKQREQLDSWLLAHIELKNGCVTNAKNCALTQKKVSAGFGLSRSSVSRYAKRMVMDGRVSKTQIVAECSIPELNDVTAREWMEKNPEKKFFAWHDVDHGGWSGWVYYGCIYSIIDRQVSESFKHVIWTYRHGDSKSTDNFNNTPDGEGYWSRFA